MCWVFLFMGVSVWKDSVGGSLFRGVSVQGSLILDRLYSLGFILVVHWPHLMLCGGQVVVCVASRAWVPHRSGVDAWQGVYMACIHHHLDRMTDTCKNITFLPVFVCSINREHFSYIPLPTYTPHNQFRAGWCITLVLVGMPFLRGRVVYAFVVSQYYCFWWPTVDVDIMHWYGTVLQ